MSRKHRGRRRRKRRLPATYPSFAKALEERSRLRQVSLAVPAADYAPVVKAKKRFGPLAVARFVASVVKAVVKLCQSAEAK